MLVLNVFSVGKKWAFGQPQQNGCHQRLPRGRHVRLNLAAPFRSARSTIVPHDISMNFFEASHYLWQKLPVKRSLGLTTLLFASRSLPCNTHSSSDIDSRAQLISIDVEFIAANSGALGDPI